MYHNSLTKSLTVKCFSYFQPLTTTHSTMKNHLETPLLWNCQVRGTGVCNAL